MAYLVVLVAALFHAVWNSMVKDSHDRLLALTGIRTVGFLYGIAVVVLFPPLEPAAVPYLLGGSLILFLYYWFLLNTYRVGDFSQVYPISRGSAPIMVLLLGAMAAGEYLSSLQAAAVLLIGSGILALAFVSGRLSALPVVYAMGTACCIAGYTVINGMGARLAGSAIVYGGWLEALCGLSVLMFAGVTRKGQLLLHMKVHWLKSLLSGLLSVLGFLAALWAMTRAPLATVTALRETSIIFAAVIGAINLKEGHTGYRISAACVVVTGIAILVINS